MDYTKYSIDEIKEKLKSCLTTERYLHSIGVMEMAEELADKYGCNVEKSKLAGLLHDCAKCLPYEELMQYKNYILECELQSIKTWHAPIGAIIAKEQYGITDKEILNAIRWHTIGNTEMSILDKIVFLADKIERRTRESDMRDKITKVLDETKSLDSAMLESFKITIDSLLKRNLTICYQTIDIYNKLLVTCAV